ncbi:MAG: ketopantoate reductase family protein, partial [bacterium]
KILIFGLGSIGSYLAFLVKKGIENLENIKLDLLTYNKRESNLFFLDIFNEQKLLNKIKIQLNNNLENEIFDIVIIACKSYDLIKYIDFLLRNNIKFNNLVLTQNGVEHEEEIINYLRNKWNIEFLNIFLLTILAPLKLKENSLYIYNYKRNELVLSSYINKFNNEILKLKEILDFNVNIHLYYGNYNDVKYSKLLLNAIMNIVPAYYKKDIKETYKDFQAIIDEKNLISEISWFIENSNLKFYKFKNYNTKLIANLYKILPTKIIYYIYNQELIIKKIRSNRIPSFIEDYVINPKKETEIEYYLGNIIKKAKKLNLDLNNLKTISKIYDKLKG